MVMEHKPASEIEPGDILYVDGRELHDDLAGFDFSVHVERIEPADDGYVDVFEPGSDERIWWKPDEVVRFIHPR